MPYIILCGIFFKIFCQFQYYIYICTNQNHIPIEQGFLLIFSMNKNYPISLPDKCENRMVLIDISQYNIDKAYADTIEHTDDNVIILDI